MAPEQASGENPVDHRADIWSLGVILYECLSGVRPIEGENLTQVVARLMSAGIMPLEGIAPEIPSDVASLVKQMLTRDIARRPPSLIEVSRTLSRFTHVRAPEFAAPSGGERVSSPPLKLESVRPKARLVASRDADPQGPTMLSSPPVNSSLHLQQAPQTRRSGYALAALGMALLTLVIWLSGSKSRDGTASTAELPSLPAVAERGTAPEPTGSASPVEALPAPPAPSAADKLAAPGAPRRRPKSQSNGATPRPDLTNDDSLFSGRK
jgi:serine/threonine-protein kinase